MSKKKRYNFIDSSDSETDGENHGNTLTIVEVHATEENLQMFGELAISDDAHSTSSITKETVEVLDISKPKQYVDDTSKSVEMASTFPATTELDATQTVATDFIDQLTAPGKNLASDNTRSAVLIEDDEDTFLPALGHQSVHIEDDEVIVTHCIASSASGIQADEDEDDLETVASDKNFFMENKETLDYVAERSRFAKYKIKIRDAHQDVVNLIATSNKIDNKSLTNQRKFQQTVYPIYNSLKTKGFPKKDLAEMLQKSLTVIEKTSTPTILKFFKPFLPAKSRESVPPSKTIPTVTALKAGGDQARNKRSFGEEQNKKRVEEEKKKKEEIANKRAMEGLLSLLLEKNESLDVYKHVSKANIDKDTVNVTSQKLYKFQIEYNIFKDNKSRRGQDDSQFQHCIDLAETEIGALKLLCQDYQKLSEEGHEEVDRTTKLDEKARILNKLLTERKEAAIKIHDCLLRINVSNTLEKGRKELRKRNLTKQARKNECVNQDDYYVSHNGHLTWPECLEALCDKEPSSNGVTLRVPEADAIREAFKQNGILGIDDVMLAVNGNQHQEAGYRALILKHLPIIALKKSNYEEKFIEAKTFLAQPSLIVEMWEMQSHFQVLIQFLCSSFQKYYISGLQP